MRILAIETSCDETALALVEATGGLLAPRFKILKNQVASQIKIHAPFGGVVPNLAKREHARNLPILFKKLFPKIQAGIEGDESRPKFVFRVLSPRGVKTTKRSPEQKDCFASLAMTTEQIKRYLPVDEIVATSGPGLEPALWVGIAFAKDLARVSGIPVHGANHLEGHLYSFLLSQKRVSTKKQAPKNKLGKNAGETRLGLGFGAWNLLFPAVALLVSGGHTILLRMDSLTKWKHLGETRDDAAGEAFDKVARMLSLPYPGGPSLSKLALEGDPRAIEFPRPMIHDKNFDFSFSGLKTSVLYYLRDQQRNPNVTKTSEFPEKKSEAFGSFGYNSDFSGRSKADVAASFQQAVVDVLSGKVMKAAEVCGARSIFLSGGVAANVALRDRLKFEAKKAGCGFYVSAFKYNTDNAVMMAVAGYLQSLRKKKFPLRANGNLGI